jgi:SAM-dependent methyltransferase
VGRCADPVTTRRAHLEHPFVADVHGAGFRAARLAHVPDARAGDGHDARVACFAVRCSNRGGALEGLTIRVGTWWALEDDVAPGHPRGSHAMDWVKDFYTQAGRWWGPTTHQPQHATRAATLERLCGPGPKRILDLGAGCGGTAAALADRGHHVIAVEFNPTALDYAYQLVALPRPGTLTVVAADFSTVTVEGRFDVVCYWEGFGVGTDADQRRLLQRIARHWLPPSGCLLLEVFSPTGPARAAGREEWQPPVAGAPDAIELLHRSHFDPVRCRWIDEWQPRADPSQARAQSIRCYTPADLLLLLEGTGLALQRLEVQGEALDVAASPTAMSGPLLEAFTYLAQLIPVASACPRHGAVST